MFVRHMCVGGISVQVRMHVKTEPDISANWYSETGLEFEIRPVISYQ